MPSPPLKSILTAIHQRPDNDRERSTDNMDSSLEDPLRSPGLSQIQETVEATGTPVRPPVLKSAEEVEIELTTDQELPDTGIIEREVFHAHSSPKIRRSNNVEYVEETQGKSS